MSGEGRLPYDKTLVTKALANGDSNDFYMRDEQFFKDSDIDVVN